MKSMKFVLISLLSLSVAGSAFSQKDAEASFTLQVSADTVAPGGTLEAKYNLENAKVKNFSQPHFGEFSLAGGPSTQTSMSIINGAVSQSASYTYVLRAPETEGVYTIPSVSVESSTGTVTSESRKIVVKEGYVPPRKKQMAMQPRRDPFQDLFGPPSYQYRQQPQQPQPPAPRQAPVKPKKPLKEYSL
jgi:hypothetical protein